MACDAAAKGDQSPPEALATSHTQTRRTTGKQQQEAHIRHVQRGQGNGDPKRATGTPQWVPRHGDPSMGATTSRAAEIFTLFVLCVLYQGPKRFVQ